MPILYIITGVLLGISLIANPRKTRHALRIALQRFNKLAPAFLGMLVLVAVALSLVPDDLLAQTLSRENKWIASASALGIGSLSIMPGFVAFPLCGILLEHGALYMVLSAFSTTLMSVGVVTFPIEKAILGTRLALVRNAVAFIIAIVVALATGLFFGELL